MDVTVTDGVCASPTDGFLQFFISMPDPRGYNAIHKLADMVVIAVLAVICGADGWVQVAMFGRSKRKWLSTFLDLPGGIPSHDTFGRVFARLDPDAFEQCFMAWMQSLVKTCGGKLIAIDGKAIRRSFQQAWDKSGMAHMVSAFVRENHMVFGQLTVEDKSNEIVAIPKLLALLDITGAVVTIDAMGCQRDIAAQIIEGDADYILSLKDNQPKLLKKAQQLMTEAALDHAKSGGKPQSDGSDGSTRYSFVETVDGDHGRIETRRVLVSDEVAALGKTVIKAWKGINSVVRVESIRDVGGKVSVEHRLYISSIKALDAARFCDLIRGHWSVENNLHWQLDMSFDEDQRRIRKGHGAENFSRLSRLALNLHKADKTLQVGIKTKRLTAGWDHDHLLRLITT